MTNSILKHAAAAGAAIATTLVLFSAVASLADHDKATLVAAKSVRGTQVVEATSAVQH